MASTTIAKPAGGSITLEGDGLSFIGEDSVRKEAIMTPMPLYLLDSDETEVFDIGGTMKSLNISGIYIGASVAACKTWMDALEALINGHQDTDSGYPVNYVSDFRGTVKVKILETETTKQAGEPLIVRWVLKLLQASTLV